MLNRVVLIGRLTRDPESQYTPSGVALAKFTVAVDRFSRNPETGEKETDFIPVIAWRKTAEFVTQYVTKGRLVSVDGRMQVRSWTGPDGTKRYMTEVVADSVQSLDRARDGSGEEGGFKSDGSEYGTPPPARNPQSASSAPVSDDFDPFADE